jgi:N-formylglutamate deformylase
VQRRVTQYYEPYHQCLKEMIDLAHSTFGQVWHINCHSLKADISDAGRYEASTRGEGDWRGWPEIVISDFNGSTAGSEFTEWLAGQFDALGYRTLIVAPYHGGYIVQNYGVPMQGRHSVQIAIRRSLYMDEKTFEKTENFSNVQHDLETFMTALSAYVQQKKTA